MTAELVQQGRDRPSPVFSICVPQHNRTSFFVQAIASFAAQRMREVEVCVSDGGSTDGREAEVVAALQASGLGFAYRRSPVNLRYDANTRTAIGLARGRYCLLMGNDDSLNGPDALTRLWDDLQAQGFPAVAISDFCDDRTGSAARRIRRDGLYPGDPRTAALHYRNFSFVSGVTLDREFAQAEATDRWDGAEMYQTYVGCRIIAGGRPLLERTHQLVRKDLVVPGEVVDSVTRRPRVWPCPVIERQTTLAQHPRLVADAVAPFAGRSAARWNEAVLLQHLLFTLPYWLFEWRRMQSWQYAAGVALGLKPTRSAAGLRLGWRVVRVWTAYFAAVAGGLFIPVRWFESAKEWLYRLAKSVR